MMIEKSNWQANRSNTIIAQINKVAQTYDLKCKKVLDLNTYSGPIRPLIPI